MNNDSTLESTSREPLIDTALNESEVECGTVCYHPECACRERTIAGCSLPLATPNTVQIERRTQNNAREIS